MPQGAHSQPAMSVAAYRGMMASGALWCAVLMVAMADGTHPRIGAGLLVWCLLALAVVIVTLLALAVRGDGPARARSAEPRPVTAKSLLGYASMGAAVVAMGRMGIDLSHGDLALAVPASARPVLSLVVTVTSAALPLAFLRPRA